MVVSQRLAVASLCLALAVACSDADGPARDAAESRGTDDAEKVGDVTAPDVSAGGGPAGQGDASAPSDAPANAGPPPLDSGVAAAADATSAGSLPPGHCLADEDCRLVDDCCHCAALAKADATPVCEQKTACLQSACFKHPGLGVPRCASGRCVLGFDCDATTVACKRAAPTCLPGQVPTVVGEGTNRCYGECVAARECTFVLTCDVCMTGDTCREASGRAHCLPSSL